MKAIPLTFLAFIILSGTACAQSITVVPSVKNVSIWTMATASVNISLNSVTNLYGYQFDIIYSQSVLNSTGITVTEGPFLKTGGISTLWIPPSTSTAGRIRNIASTRTGTTNVSGTGNVTTITFGIMQDVMTPATSQVGITNDKLSNIYSQAITHSRTNGTINVLACLPGETKPCGSNVGECRSGTQSCLPNYTWNATCGGTYRGPSAEFCDGLDSDCDGVPDYSESLTRACSVTHYGICAVGTETCCVGQGGCPAANWTGCPLSQPEICGNVVDEDCDGTPSLCKGDVNQNGCIDIADLAIVALDFGKTSGFADPRSDIDTNGAVDIFDLVYVGKDFGVGC